VEPGETFNTVASIYDAQRTGYPEALFDDLLEICRLEPDHRVLEVGCGTGQATVGFAARGLRVVAIDPGDRLLDVARPKFVEFPNVQFEIGSFEDWPLGERTFHLVAAAQSWHWVRPEVGFEKASRALSLGGHLAISATRRAGRLRSWALCSPSISGSLQKSGVLRPRIGIFREGRFPISLRQAGASSESSTATTRGRANIPLKPSQLILELAPITSGWRKTAVRLCWRRSNWLFRVKLTRGGRQISTSRPPGSAEAERRIQRRGSPRAFGSRPPEQPDG
jgi:SAM-dependent methyltransferase